MVEGGAAQHGVPVTGASGCVEPGHEGGAAGGGRANGGCGSLPVHPCGNFGVLLQDPVGGPPARSPWRSCRCSVAGSPFLPDAVRLASHSPACAPSSGLARSQIPPNVVARRCDLRKRRDAPCGTRPDGHVAQRVAEPAPARAGSSSQSGTAGGEARRFAKRDRVVPQRVAMRMGYRFGGSARRVD